ncbi:MAG TPA: site-specific integrase, partial [Chlamydiales bacterium]
MDFLQATEQFLSHLQLAKGASEHTLRGYRTDFQSFAQFFKTGELGKINKHLIRRYLASLHEQKAATKTILRRLSSLRSFYRFAIREKLALENPLEEIDSPKKE